MGFNSFKPSELFFLFIQENFNDSNTIGIMKYVRDRGSSYVRDRGSSS